MFYYSYSILRDMVDPLVSSVFTEEVINQIKQELSLKI